MTTLFIFNTETEFKALTRNTNTTYSYSSFVETQEILNFTVSTVASVTVNATEITQSNKLILLQQSEKYLWRCISPILILIGVFGNILNISVVWRMKFWRKTPLFLLAVLAVTDITILLDGLLRYWINYTFDFDIRSISNGSCKVNLFVIYFSMQFSSWILVCMTVDRFFKTNFPFAYIRIVTIKKTVVIVLCTFVVLSAVNLHFFWTNGLVDGECTSVNEKYFNFEEYTFVYIDLVLLSVIPFLIMAVLNCFIYRALKEQISFRSTSVVGSTRHRRQDNKRHNKRQFSRKLTRMLLFVSCYFLVSTVPISAYFIFDSYVHYDDNALYDARKDVAWSILYLFQYSNYSLNFIWYAAHNKVFREKMKEVLGFKSKG